MAKYNVKVLESAGRYAVKDAGGIKYLANTVIGDKMERSMSIEQASRLYTRDNIMAYTEDREAWLNRNGISYKDANKTFDEIFGKIATAKIIVF